MYYDKVGAISCCAKQYLPKGGDVKKCYATKYPQAMFEHNCEKAVSIAHNILSVVQPTRQPVTTSQYSCRSVTQPSHLYTSHLWEQYPGGKGKIRSQILRQVTNCPHIFYDHLKYRVLNKVSHPVFTICGSIPSRNVCLSSWKSNIKVYNLISTRDETRNLVFLRDISAETYGIFQFVCT